MISEAEYKKNLIQKLNQQNNGWIDGDKEIKPGNKVDIINHKLKIAIEIKDEVKGGNSLEKGNKQSGEHIRAANKKFKNYSNKYRTILLIKGNDNTLPEIVRYRIDGLIIFSKFHNYLGRVNKYKESIKKEIGSFLIFADKYYYFSNEDALTNRIICKQEIEKILNESVEDVKKICAEDFLITKIH